MQDKISCKIWLINSNIFIFELLDKYTSIKLTKQFKNNIRMLKSPVPFEFFIKLDSCTLSSYEFYHLQEILLYYYSKWKIWSCT